MDAVVYAVSDKTHQKNIYEFALIEIKNGEKKLRADFSPAAPFWRPGLRVCRRLLAFLAEFTMTIFLS